MNEAAGSVGRPAPLPIRAVPVRHWGRWVAAVLVLLALGGIAWAFAVGQIDWPTVGRYLFASVMLQGVGNTVLVSVGSMLLGLILGVAFAVMRLSRNPVTSGVAWLYIWFFRGTPVLVQLLIWYNLALVFRTFTIPGVYSAPMSQVMTPFLATLLGLGINEGAYMAEIVRAGISSVDHGQTEASQALGMTGGKTMRRIVLPQAMRVIVPPTGNEFINLLKTSSLASVITYGELMRSAQNVYTRTLQTVELLFVASIWYLAITTVFSSGQYYVERHFSQGSAVEQGPTPLQRIASLVLSVRHARLPGGAR
ncbi:ABC transporter permease [Mangrovactinospora gilvigrisea]|uniref:ABC transporter permease n=1 Tax=Mangrovactinospora gilvigrisea TaxID=1428644 RepID=A0A1J7C7A6_9ACTN|nr:amino acid ABC transporter permease [Mangrovactinospora gilvigrisea]OIV35530.1 ABC transporter permease [Mangrovactinospora gilvigrisea]